MLLVPGDMQSVCRDAPIQPAGLAICYQPDGGSLHLATPGSLAQSCATTGKICGADPLGRGPGMIVRKSRVPLVFGCGHAH
jgi:hypothetical protein